MPLNVTINGELTDMSHIDRDTPLLWALRDHLGLVGTKYGCGIAQCGACTVWLDGDPARACQLPLDQLEGFHDGGSCFDFGCTAGLGPARCGAVWLLSGGSDHVGGSAAGA